MKLLFCEFPNRICDVLVVIEVEVRLLYVAMLE
jgi:hypothetical protein